jgi:hypothetical protein
MIKGFRKLISLLLALITTISATGLMTSARIASIKSGDIKYVTSFTSSTAFKNDYYTITINNSSRQMTIKGRTLLDMDKVELIIRYQAYASTVKSGEGSINKKGEYKKTISFSGISSGHYYVVARFRRNGASYATGTYHIRGIPVTVMSSGKAYINKYPTVMKQNSDVRAKAEKYMPESYMDKYGKDILETDGGLTKTQMEYMKKVAKNIVGKETSATKKALLLHSWVSRNFYYDYPGHDLGASKEVNPYKLVKTFKSGKKAKTVCDGFAAIYCVLARCVGIPCRIAMGKSIAMPNERWETQDSLLPIEHYWDEVFINGEWFIVDTLRDTSNNLSLGYTWIKYSFIRYQYFHPSPASLAVTHLYIEYRPGSRDVAYTINENDINSVANFLKNKTSSGSQNGKIINRDFAADDPSTWEKKKGTVITNGFGRIYRIKWDGIGLEGPMKLSKMTKLKSLNVPNNKITSLDTTGCTYLHKVYCKNNNLTSINIPSSKYLELLSALENPATSIKYKFGTSKTAKLTAEGPGTIGVYFVGPKSHHLVATPIEDGVFKGWYDTNGKLVTTKASVWVKRTASFTYKAIFERKTQGFITSINGEGKKINLTWDRVKDAKKYALYRCETKDGEYKKITTTTALKYSDTTAVAGKLYYYKVAGIDKDGKEKKQSKPKTAIAIGTPTLKSVTKSGKNVTVSWGKASGAESYTIYRSATKDGTYTKVATVGNVATYTYTQTTSSKYYYKVRGFKKVSGTSYYGSYSSAKTHS